MATKMELVKVFFDGNEMPIEDIYVRISRAPNLHDTALLTGYMKADVYDQYVYLSSESIKLEIRFMEDKSEKLKYCGIIDEIEVRSEGVKEGGVYHLTLRSSAYTKKLDIKKIKKSLQDENQTLDDEIREMLDEFPDADFKNEIAKGKAAGHFRLAYHETIYEYLVRRASEYHHFVVCISNDFRARFRWGINSFPDKGNLEQYEYTICNRVGSYRITEQNNYYEDVNELDFIEYRILLREGEDTLDIGDMITYRDIPLVVKEAEIEIKDHHRYCTYTLGMKNCLRTKQMFNEQIVGISIIGKVIAVEHNEIKLHLEIDEEQEVGKACWFGYLTSYATKYVMPEINDYVNLYFPINDEKAAISINSFKQNPEGGYMRTNEPPEYPLGSDSPILDFIAEAHNPETKMFVNKYGLAVAMNEKTVKVILDDDNYVLVDRDDGITIHSDKLVHVQADEQITLKAKKNIILEAREQILVHSGTSKIELLPEKIKIRSEETDMN